MTERTPVSSHRAITALVVTLVLLAGLPTTGVGGATSASTTAPADPDTDVIGWENGYWHNESLDLSHSEGLSEEELDRYAARAMARVEHIRGTEFTENVPVSVISRDEYEADNSLETNPDSEFADWNNQVWEALFIVDEHSNAQAKINGLYQSNVLGYYDQETDEIVIVSPEGQTLKLPESTLVHELAHALQDQRHNLSQPKYSGTTQDAQLGTNGLIEGEAKYIEQRYTSRCTEDDWECETVRAQSSGSGQSNIGVQLLTYQPYSDGPGYIDHLLDRGGWDAVDAAFTTPPDSSREIIHPGATSARNVSLQDTSFAGWERFPDKHGANGTDSVGEVSIYMMFWYQNYAYGNGGIIPRGDISATTEQYDGYNYNHSVPAGLIGDRIAPYRNGDDRGYVWKTAWNTTDDASEFADAYRTLLKSHDAEKHDDGWVIESGGYEDAFVVVQQGDTVYISNGPTLSDASGLLPDAASDPTTHAGNQTWTTTQGETGPSEHVDDPFPSPGYLLVHVLPPILALLTLVLLFISRG